MTQTMSGSESITRNSDLSDTARSIHIVTTASLPWMTGTAVNPLLRALYLQRTRTSGAKVTLIIPWVEREEERNEVYGPNVKFSNGREGRKEQETLVRDWAKNKAGMVEESELIRIQFYPGTYQKKLGSILTLVDICSLIPASQADIAILEEPEHLTWFPLPRYEKNNMNKYGNESQHDDFMPTNDIGWTQKFRHVVGIVHTNYPAYAKSYGVRGSRTLTSKSILGLSILVCRSYCHKIVKLSATLPTMARYKECICNVHGVRSDFLRAPTAKDESDQKNHEGARAYFIGKILWAKGFDFLLHCQEKYRCDTGEYFPIDIYGGGPDEEKIKRSFHGVRKQSHVDLTSAVDTHEHEGEEIFDEDIDSCHPSEQSEEDKDDDEKIASFRKKLYEKMLMAMPFLMEDVNNEEEEEAKQDEEKISTMQTIRDGLKMLRRLPKEKFQFDLSNLPKTRHEWRKKPIPANFVGPKDHAALKFTSHKIFVNPSITEVLCTTSAEALAMGKFVILPRHPSNGFFYQFPNCLAYKDMDEFVSHMKYAMNNDPPPMSPELAYTFTWEAAMDRLIESSAITDVEYENLQASGKLIKDKRKAWIHQESGRLIKGEMLKSLLGGPPQEDLRNYQIDEDREFSVEEMISFENTNPKILALLSFIIAIISYFVQR